MRKNIYIICLSFFSATAMFAQSSVVEDLNQSKKGEGNVKVYQDDSITKAIESLPVTPISKDTSNSTTNSNTNTTTTIKQTSSSSRGYKIQVFSGNDQKKSKNEANHRQNLVKSRFPQLHVTISYSAPVWTVTAGGFASRADADKALQELRAAFPSFGREMYVIR